MSPQPTVTQSHVGSSVTETAYSKNNEPPSLFQKPTYIRRSWAELDSHNEGTEKTRSYEKGQLTDVGKILRVDFPFFCLLFNRRVYGFQ